jgi:hypothetical protein
MTVSLAVKIQRDPIWYALAMDLENACLLQYYKDRNYKDRKIWLFQPDINNMRLDPRGDKP